MKYLAKQTLVIAMLILGVTGAWAQTVTKLTNGTWIFTMPNGDRTLNVVQIEECGLVWQIDGQPVPTVGVSGYVGYESLVTFPTLSNEKGVSVRYGSTNTTVATINNANGNEIKLVGTGTTTIYAVHDAGENYLYDSAYYTLTVNASYTLTLTSNPSSGNAGHLELDSVNHALPAGVVAGDAPYKYIVDPGTTVKVKAVPAPHYHLAAWNNTGGNALQQEVTITQNTEITGVFAIDTFTLTLQTNDINKGTVEVTNHNGAIVSHGTDANGTSTYRVNYGTEVIIQATPEDHYHLESWSNGATVNTDDTIHVIVTTDSTITANFAPYPTLTLIADGNGTVTLGGINVETFNNFQSDQYDYTGENFQLHVDNLLDGGFRIYHNNFVIYYYYTATITSLDGENITKVELIRGSSNCTNGFYNDLNRLTVDHGTLSTNGDTATITGINATSLTIGAELQTDIRVGKVKVYYGTLPEGVTENPAGGYYCAPNTQVTVKAIPDEHHHLASWSNIEGTASQQNITVTKDSSITAHFVINTYTIAATVDPANSGTVTGAGTYNHGATCTLTATPAEGYHFVNWTKGDTEVSTEASYSFTVTHDSAFVANFAINTYTLTLNDNGNGNGFAAVKTPLPAGVTDNQNGTYTVNHDTTVTVKATPNEHYHLTGWSNGSSLNEYDTIHVTVTKDSTIKANFAIDQYTITAVVADGQGTMGLVNGAGIYDYGKSCTLTATPDPGYRFVNWTENDTVVANAGEVYTFTVTSARTLKANFAINFYTVTLNDDSVDTDNWTGKVGDATTYSAFPLEDVTVTQTVTVKYDGTRTVKSITATVVDPEESAGPTLSTPLTMVALTAGTINVHNPPLRMKYRLNSGEKKLMFYEAHPQTNIKTIDVSVGDTVEFYGNFNNITSYEGTYISGGTAQVKLYGNIMSLISEEHFATANLVLERYAFKFLFSGNTMLTDASGLLLPAIYVNYNIYESMFQGCTNLTAAPKLTLTEMDRECYRYMFKNCTNLSSVTCLATYIESGSTDDWLSGVSNTGTFYKAADANWEEGASGIPSNWTIVNVESQTNPEVTPTTNANEWTFAMPAGNVKLQATYYELPELAWNNLPAEGSVTGYVGFENLTAFPSLYNPHELSPITFASTDPTVATINADGDITFVAPGTTTIRAIYLGDDTYQKDTTSYQLTVLAPAMLTLEAGVDGTVEMAGGSMLSDSVKAGITAGTYSVIPGTEVTLNAEAIALHHVAGWSDEEQHDLSANATYSEYAVTNPDRFPAKSSINVTVTGDTTMMATFGINSYEVNAAVANGQGERGTVQIAYTNADNQTQTVATTATVTSVQAAALSGSTTTLTAIPEAGHHFVNWTNGDVILGTGAVLTTTEALTATANFAITPAELSWSSNTFTGYTYIDFNNYKPTLDNPNNVNVRYGLVENVSSVKVNPGTGYISNSFNAPILYTPGTYHVYAVHETDQTYYYDSVVYTLNVNRTALVSVSQNIEEGGSIAFVDAENDLTHSYSIGNAMIAYLAPGANFKATATASAGYHFSKWQTGNIIGGYTDFASTNTTTYTAPAEITDIFTDGLRAVFDTNTYALKVLSADAEMGSGNGSTTAKHFLNYEISATPNTGYHFVQWNDGNTANPRTVTLTSDSTFTASFAPNSYTITYMDGETELNVDTFDYRQPITEYTSSKDGWDFIGWSPAVPDLMPAENLTVYAQWFYICHPVTDIDNNTYSSVNIGNICWMTSNMRATHYADGQREIANIYVYATPLHPNAEENLLLYGRLYDWYDALDASRPTKSVQVQGICPNGWVIPNEEDFETLNHVNLHTLLSSNYWVYNNGDNSTGFDLKPSGMYNINLSRYEELLSSAYLWSATATSATEAHCHEASCHCNDTLLDLIRQKDNAYSVRCVKKP